MFDRDNTNTVRPASHLGSSHSVGFVANVKGNANEMALMQNSSRPLFVVAVAIEKSPPHTGITTHTIQTDVSIH